MTNKQKLTLDDIDIKNVVSKADLLRFANSKISVYTSDNVEHKCIVGAPDLNDQNCMGVFLHMWPGYAGSKTCIGYILKNGCAIILKESNYIIPNSSYKSLLSYSEFVTNMTKNSLSTQNEEESQNTINQPSKNLTKPKETQMNENKSKSASIQFGKILQHSDVAKYIKTKVTAYNVYGNAFEATVNDIDSYDKDHCAVIFSMGQDYYNSPLCLGYILDNGTAIILRDVHKGEKAVEYSSDLIYGKFYALAGNTKAFHGNPASEKKVSEFKAGISIQIDKEFMKDIFPIYRRIEAKFKTISTLIDGEKKKVVKEHLTESLTSWAMRTSDGGKVITIDIDGEYALKVAEFIETFSDEVARLTVGFFTLVNPKAMEALFTEKIAAIFKRNKELK